MLHTKLHLAGNKIYDHKHNFDDMIKYSGKSGDIDEEMKELNIDPLEDIDYSDQYKFGIDESQSYRSEYNVSAIY